MEGFSAGATEEPVECPYEAPSLEAVVWRKGWVEGAAKRLGYSHAEVPPWEGMNPPEKQ